MLFVTRILDTDTNCYADSLDRFAILISSTDNLDDCLESMVVYLYWSGQGGGVVPEGLNFTPIDDCSDIAFVQGLFITFCAS